MRIRQEQQASGRGQTRELSGVAATILALAITLIVTGVVAFVIDLILHAL